MKEWYATNELAGLPGMPKYQRSVTRKATGENYKSRKRTGKGGGKEYHISSLPEATKDAIHAKSLENAPVPTKDPETTALIEAAPVDLQAIKKWQREIFEARLLIYREFEQLKTLYGTNKGIAKLVAMAKTGTLPEHLQQAVTRANARRGKKGRTLSRSMLMRWQTEVTRKGITGLVPEGLPEQPTPEWATYFIKTYNTPQKPSIPEAMAIMETILPKEIPMPSYGQIRRWNDKRSRLDRERGRHSAGALRQFKGYCTRDTSDLHPLDVCLCDGHSFKSKVAHPDHGRPFKPEVCAVIDAATRMVLGWSTGLAESALTVADAVRHAVTINKNKPYGGVPAIFYTDQGAGNTADQNANDETGIFARCGITAKTGIPGNAQARGLVEKLNQILWIRAAKLLPTFVGKTMDATTARRMYLQLDKDVRQGKQSEELISWQNFLLLCQQAVDYYNNRPHSALPKMRDKETGKIRHQSPMEAWASHLASGWKPFTLEPEIMEDLFRPQVIRKALRGQVSLHGNYYANNKVLEHYHGESVIVEFDIHDATFVRIRDIEQRFLCTAKFEGNKRSFFPITEVERARANREKNRMKAVNNKVEEIKLEAQGTMDLLQAPTKLTMDEEFAAAQLLAETEPYAEPVAVPGRTIDARQEFAEKRKAAEDQRWQQLDGWQRYEYLMNLTELSASQTKWVDYYRTTQEFDTLKDIYEEMGLAGAPR